MRSFVRFLSSTVTVILAGASLTRAADLSPGNWPKAQRDRIETLEAQTTSPRQKQSVESPGGIVLATLSPISVHAGVQTLRAGGNAADAAAATALTQVTPQLGAVVSYPGVFSVLYYDAKAHKVYSLDAGFNSYLNETDPKTIPACDLSLQADSPRKPTEGGAKGRETLVPGFMAGVEAMHSRFGRLPFRDLFAPPLWYAEHGVHISPMLQGYLRSRAPFLRRTAEGQDFLRGGRPLTQKPGLLRSIEGRLLGGNDLPLAGDLFLQPALAKTLKAVSEQGSRYMYTGQWAEHFIKLVQRDGGKVTPEDLRRYQPLWTDPYRETVFTHTAYVNGPPHWGACTLFAGLNLAEALKLDQRRPYWEDPESFRTLTRIGQFTVIAPTINDAASNLLKSKGVDLSLDAQLGKSYASAVAPLLESLFVKQTDATPEHTDGIVVVDKDGNIAAITHSINTVIWGDTGIVVDGIPLPDSAGFQQTTLASIKPGDRVPNRIIDTIAFEGETPVLATAGVGSLLGPESIRVLLCVLGQRQDLATTMAAPPLLATLDAGRPEKPLSLQPLVIPQGAYGPDFTARLKTLGLPVTEMSDALAARMRGTLAAVAIDPKTHKRTAAAQPGVIVFNAVE